MDPYDNDNDRPPRYPPQHYPPPYANNSRTESTHSSGEHKPGHPNRPAQQCGIRDNNIEDLFMPLWERNEPGEAVLPSSNSNLSRDSRDHDSCVSSYESCFDFGSDAAEGSSLEEAMKVEVGRFGKFDGDPFKKKTKKKKNKKGKPVQEPPQPKPKVASLVEEATNECFV
jgi:hypothetical protein